MGARWMAIAMAAVLGGVAACGAPTPMTPDGSSPVDGGSDFCTDDDQCDDTVYCNGRELCRPGAADADERGCLDARGRACAQTQRCDEASDRCETDCDIAPDADGDGVMAIACGGTDCDDADPRRFPGNTEVCDGAQHDEDCDPATYGLRDEDGDGAPSALCCNVASEGTLRCGTDCNDHDRTIAPGAAEECDRRDQDCDGTADEGVTTAAYADADRDLHGDASAPLMGCPGLPGVVLSSDDCDDTRGAVHLGAAEICDLRDDDCDGTVDEDALPVTWYRDLDGDGFGSATSGTTVSCSIPAGYSLFSTDCDDARPTTSPLSREACNGIDDDCSGLADFAVGPGDLEDDDRDGSPDLRCGAASADCDDLDPDVHPGAPELCNHRDDDCDGAVETGEIAVAWYVDRDGDGAGASGSLPIYACSAIEGRVQVGGDCDDHSAAVGPRALDACGTGVDGADDDCDGAIDEAGGASAFFDDGDGDGFGAGMPTLACTLPAGLRVRGGDCLDTDGAVHPGLVEQCVVLDTIDDDCDGLVDCLDPDCTGAAACGPPVSLTLVSGDGQAAYPGFPLPAAVVVLATSSSGAPVPGAIVHFAASAGALVTDATAVADGEGLARTYVRVGLALGPYAVTATANGATPRSLTATSIAAPDGTWLPMIDALRLGSPGAGPTGLVTGASSIAARPHALPATDAMRFVSLGAVHGLVVPLPMDHCVVSVDGAGILHVVAGRCGAPARDDADEGGPAAAASLAGPTAVALDAARHRLFVADAGNGRVRAIALDDGTISTVAGGGFEDAPALDQTAPATALRLDATQLAYDPTTNELWLGSASACLRIGLTTGTATGVPLCPPTFPHPGLSLAGGTLLGASSIGTSDVTPPPPSIPAIDTTPFGFVGISVFGAQCDVRLPTSATMGGAYVGAVGRSTGTPSFFSVGPTAGTTSAQVWRHPELGTSRVTLNVRATAGDVVTAIDASGLTWLQPGSSSGSTLLALGTGIATTTPDGLFVALGPDGARVLWRIDPMTQSFPTLFEAAGATYGRVSSLPTGGSVFEVLDLDGVVLRTERFASARPALVAHGLDGSIYFVTTIQDPFTGTQQTGVERRPASGPPELLGDLGTGPFSSMAVDASGALWLVGNRPSDGVVTLTRRNTDGSHDEVPFAPPDTMASGYFSRIARAPDGTMVVVASTLFRIDPTTLASTPVPTPGRTFDGAVGLVVDANGHTWIRDQYGPVTVVW